MNFSKFTSKGPGILASASLVSFYPELSNSDFSCPKTVADNVPYEWQSWKSKLGKQWKIAVLDYVKKAGDMIKETNVTLSSSSGELAEISVDRL